MGYNTDSLAIYPVTIPALAGGLAASTSKKPQSYINDAASLHVQAYLYACCPLCTPSANSSIILALNAGKSAGVRLVTRP